MTPRLQVQAWTLGRHEYSWHFSYYLDSNSNLYDKFLWKQDTPLREVLETLGDIVIDNFEKHTKDMLSEIVSSIFSEKEIIEFVSSYIEDEYSEKQRMYEEKLNKEAEERWAKRDSDYSGLSSAKRWL